ncbi:MAG: cytochrome c [Gammaproteobacteria bacterium]|nr:cytochrome c [Gammaproteobacteria bacterium]
MRTSRSLLLGAAAIAFLAPPLSASEGAMEYRQHTMAAVGGHTTALFDILTGKVGHTGHLAAHAEALKAMSGIAGTLFPEGSEGGDALPGIWEEAEDFAERLSAFEAAAGNLSDVVSAGGEVMPAAMELGQACKGCHDNYRAE